MTIQAEPTRARVKDKVDTAPAPAKSPVPGRARNAAAQRAYARRAQREGRPIQRAVEDDLDRGAGRVSFAVLIIVLLVVGVAATLWLSTQAIADSYRLDEVKQESERLAERAAVLQREVTQKESAASLAERAKAMGMVPAGDPARLVVQPDGTVVVVGEPTPVAPPESENPPENGQNQSEGQQPPPANGGGAG
ncbi:septum formation initiator [Actinophytocola glycyrrhizae]|uniref:Septum formation initiator n=1 Tax=Actinophytocola glycyrrhizae TaxID=2044873 RepID=A0ABV9S3M3_9PSEU